MAHTTRDRDILRAFWHYPYWRPRGLARLLAPAAKDGPAIIRGRLRLMEDDELVTRYKPRMIDPFDAQTQAPVWAMTVEGSRVLARLTDDDSKILTADRSFSDWMSINHHVALCSQHAFVIDPAFAAQEYVTKHATYWEADVIDASTKDLAKRYRLYEDFPKQKVKCCPDSAFELGFLSPRGPKRRAIYVEFETGVDSSVRAQSKKQKGYAELARSGRFKQHFPLADDFRVLVFCPSAKWRDGMRAAFVEKAAEGDKPARLKDGAELWLFVATPEVTAANFLHGEMVYKVLTGPGPLVPPPAPSADSSGGPSAGGDARVAGAVVGAEAAGEPQFVTQ